MKDTVRPPWDRSRTLAVLTWAYVIWSLVPVVIAIAFSFNDGRSRSTWQGFSTRWWTGSEGSLLDSDDLRQAIINSLVLAIVTIVVATPLGVALAIGLSRWRSRAASGSNVVMLVPLVTPEIVLGASFFIVFTQLYTAVELGRPAQIVGHITFTLSFVVVIVRSRLASIGTTLQEAARDLGATPRQALRLVILPQLWPAIIASIVIVFATSIDDFVVSSFLSGPGSDTVPMRIYNQARGGATPALNAMASMMLFVTIGAIALALGALAVARKRSGGRAAAVEDFTGFSV
ncbi:MAG TPA: ABC transporter permease [Ilumatobacter sp.]|nr:ABC transporter permease [Ilumatobacter sp.]